jgi:hypothetical protein
VTGKAHLNARVQICKEDGLSWRFQAVQSSAIQSFIGHNKDLP